MNLELDKENGNVTVEKLNITSALTIADFEAIRDDYEVLFTLGNETSQFYRIISLNGGENAIMFLFYKEKLYQLYIGAGPAYQFPPFVITEEEKEIVKDIVRMFGGEHRYPWGNVFYDVDNKAGSVSAIIRYTSPSPPVQVSAWLLHNYAIIFT